MKKRSDQVNIKEKWIKFVIENPIKTEIQSDGRIRKWAHIDEVGKYLEVTLIEDGKAFHNAFFDRSFRGGIINESKSIFLTLDTAHVEFTNREVRETKRNKRKYLRGHRCK